MVRWICSFYLIFTLNLFSGIHPDYDDLCDSMYCFRADISPMKYPEQSQYFSKAVPRIIHLISWEFTNIPQKYSVTEKHKMWEQYAQNFGYEYNLWTEENDDLLESFMDPNNFDLMLLLRSQGLYYGASEILRYELIKKFGGIFITTEFSPPQNKNGFFDFSEIIGFEGLTLMTEHFGRNIGNYSALFVGHCFIASSPNHPVLCAAVEQVYKNAMHWHGKQASFYEPYATGTMFFNKILAGHINVVPANYLLQYICY